VSCLRITIDTREDSYEDALSVLRRAYGRHRMARKTGESRPVAADEGNAVVGESVIRSSSAGRKGAGSRKGSTKGTRRPAVKRAPATSATAVSSSVPKSPGKTASGRKSARSAPASGRPAAPQGRVTAGGAANTAPRGESEAVRAWAQDQGMQVRARGRMPAKVIAAYLEAHAG
jgi:hypothetical protein